MGRFSILLLLLVAACPGPLDRRDGALLIELFDTPANTTVVSIVVHADGRRFLNAEPFRQVIDSFSALPAGPAEIEITLFDGGERLASRKLSIAITENETETIKVSFSGGPQITIAQPDAEETSHAVFDGVISIDIREQYTSEQPIDLSVTINDAIDLEALASGVGWSVEIDPRLVGEILPDVMNLQIDACFAGDPPLCNHHERRIRIHREVWTTTIAGQASARPQVWHDLVLVSEETGHLRGLNVDTGRSTFATTLAAPMAKPMAVFDDQVLLVDGDHVLRAIRLPSGTEASFSIDLIDSAGVTRSGSRAIVTSGRRLLAVDLTGQVTEIAELPNRIGAAPLADGRGIVAVDVRGNVIALDDNNQLIYQRALDASVHAPPARAGDTVIVGTLDQRVFQLDAAGNPSDPITVPGGIGHAPLVSDGGVWLAAGKHLVFLPANGGEEIVVNLASSITGAPALWPANGGVVTGTRNGMVWVVRPDGTKRALHQQPGAAMSPVAIGDADLLVAESAGVFSRLRAEGDFLP